MLYSWSAFVLLELIISCILYFKTYALNDILCDEGLGLWKVIYLFVIVSIKYTSIHLVSKYVILYIDLLKKTEEGKINEPET